MSVATQDSSKVIIPFRAINVNCSTLRMSSIITCPPWSTMSNALGFYPLSACEDTKFAYVEISVVL